MRAQASPASPTKRQADACPKKFIALSVDCNGAYVYLDPYEGGKIVVAEAARNLACSGAVPLGVTDNLNLRQPAQSGTVLAAQGIACAAWPMPAAPSTRRSPAATARLYNQSPAGPIDPTPTVAMVGLIEKPEHITTQWFKDEGDAIILLGDVVDASDPLLGLGGSAYLQRVHGLKTGTPPRCDLEKEKELHLALRALIHSGVVKSAHDCSEGGLAVALAESCISQQIARETPRLIGAQVDLTVGGGRRSPTTGDAPAAASGRPAVRRDPGAHCHFRGRGRMPARCWPRRRFWACRRRASARSAARHCKSRAGRGTLSCDVRELHDLWWNSIARAMR